MLRRTTAIVLLLSVVAIAADKPKSYQDGKLVDFTSTSEVGSVTNSYTGKSTTVSNTGYIFSVKLGDLTYVGEYWPPWRWSYVPTEWIVGDAVKVRMDKGDMYLRRDNGKEVKIRITKRVRG